jgi:hypothetical protein
LLKNGLVEMTQIFISYSRADRKFVQELTFELSEWLPKVKVFYDLLMDPKESFADTLSAQIEEADIILAVMSPDYFESSWIEQELNIAFMREAEKRVRVLPLLVRPCTPTTWLQNHVLIDFTEDYEKGLQKLIWGITGERPLGAKGERPGEPTRTIDSDDLESLRREVQDFKSRAVDTAPIPPVATHTGARTERKMRCFVVMPFEDEDLQIVYEDYVKPALVDGCNLLCERGDDVFGSDVIMDDILKSIENADVVLADLTGKNANVFYEVGICHTLRKQVILLAQSADDVPFDLRHRRVLIYDYSPRGCKRLESKLKERMNAVLKEL